MEVEAWIKQKKELYTHILSFLESESDSKNDFLALTKIIEYQKIVKNEQSIKETLQLLCKIGCNYHRCSVFFNRLALIIEYLKKEVLPIKDTEIIDIYKSNKRLLLLLFEHKVINLDESNTKYLFEKNNSTDKQLKYFFPEIKKKKIDEKTKNDIEHKITEEFNISIEKFESKIKEGENDSTICKLIRQDAIQEFVSYVNRTNLSPMRMIKADFYESNSLLIEKEACIIEYAFFYESIQIIKYLRNNHVKFTPKIFQYAIHSNNPEMIEYLEKNNIQFD